MSRRTGPGERSRTVTGVVVGARNSSVRVFCVAAVVAETGCSATDRMGPDHGDAA
jgi:hypothetical protein